jgi:hypothetical protein
MAESGRKILKTPIKVNSPAEVRKQTNRYLSTHMTIHIKNIDLAIDDLYDIMDKELVVYMPGKSAARALLKAESGVTEMATQAEDAAEKALRCKESSKTKAAAPTTESNEQLSRRTEGKLEQAKARYPCNNCGKMGHWKNECSEQRKLKTCDACGEKGHFSRRCPSQICVKCGIKGHRLADCVEEANKGKSSKYSSVEHDVLVEATEAKPVGAVLVVEGKLDGREARIGLDSFAGIGMVTASAVEERRTEWKDTGVLLQGVSPTSVKPLGQIELQIKVGGKGFSENAVICKQLPGGVDVLVSYDTLLEQGLELSKKGVVLGGQNCQVVAPTTQNKACKGPIEAVQKEKGAKHQEVLQREERELEEKRRVSKKKNEKATRKMLRQEDKNFQALESKGLIEEVLVALDGSCVGYRARAEEGLERKEKLAKKAVKKNQKKVSKRGKRATETKTRKRLEKKERREKEWQMVQQELKANVEEQQMQQQVEARKLVAAVERKSWERESWVPVASTCKAAKVIESNRGKWSQVDVKAALETEGEVSEAVELDDFCVPEQRTVEQKVQFQKDFLEKVAELAKKSALQSKGAKEEYKRIMLKHSNAYCRSLDDFIPGQLDVPELRLNVKGDPIRDARRQLSQGDEEWYREETLKFDKMGLWAKPTKKMEDDGLWVSNVVVVKTVEKEGSGTIKRRMTFDYWGPNEHIDPPPQRIPTVAELADRVQGAVLFDKDDGISGYYQWKLHEESKRFTAVYTPLGLRVFNCMPLGINVAPSEWNGAMADKFGDLPGNRLFSLMDDFVRFTPGKDGMSREELELDHMRLLDEFLTRVEAMKLKLKLPKAVHAVEQIEALGMVYGHGKMEKTDWTTSVISNYPVPRSAKQMERFLALGQYYSNFVENYARLVSPLRVLQRKKRWGHNDMAEGSKERELFEFVRAELTKELRLALPDWSKEFIIKSDFSSEAMGGALLQKDEHGKLRAVGFVSRKCTPAEAKLSAADGEMAALVWTINRFEKFLIGKKFTAYVDQGSLSWLKDRVLGSINNKRLQHSFAYLRQFKFDLLYLKSEMMGEVDALSRIKKVEGAATMMACGREGTTICMMEARDEEGNQPVPAGSVAQVDMEGFWGFETELRDIGELQQVDDEVIAIRGIREGRKWGDLEVTPTARDSINKYMSQDPKCEKFVEGEDGRLYHLETKNGEMVRQLYVPVVMRGRLVVTKHGSETGGHRASEETLGKLRKRYYWASIRRDVEGWISACGCQRKKGEKKQKVGEMASLKIMRPGEKIIFDIFGPLPVSLKGNVYLLVMMDVGTREMMLEALPTRAAAGVAKAIYRRVYLSGKSPRIFQSDLAKEFVSKIVEELIVQLGGKFRHSSPYHPQTNTHVERYNKTLATNLSLLLKREDQKDWDEYLGEVEYAQLVGAQKVLGNVSPLFLRGGWDALDPLDRAMGVDDSSARSVVVGEWIERIKRARQIAMQSQVLAVARDAKRYNEKAKKLKIDVGDEVWVMFPNVGTGRSKKLAFRLHGPYKLQNWLGEKRRTATLGHVGNEKDTITAHVDRIVKKNMLPERLVEAWKPLRLNGVKYDKAEVERVELEEEREEREDELAEKVERELDPEVAKEVGKKLVDEEEPDDGHFIEKILDHRDDEEDGGREYKVRFVGHGPDKDLWYWDEHLMESAPEMVAEYEEEEEMKAQLKINERREGRKGKKRRTKARGKDWGDKTGGNVAQDAANAIRNGIQRKYGN